MSVASTPLDGRNRLDAFDAGHRASARADRGGLRVPGGRRAHPDPGTVRAMALVAPAAIQVAPDRDFAAVRLRRRRGRPGAGRGRHRGDRLPRGAGRSQRRPVRLHLERAARSAVRDHGVLGRRSAVPRGRRVARAPRRSSRWRSRATARGSAAMLVTGGRSEVWIAGHRARTTENVPVRLGEAVPLGPLVGPGSGLAWLDDTTVGVLSAEAGGLAVHRAARRRAGDRDRRAAGRGIRRRRHLDLDGATAHGGRLALRQARGELAAHDERHPDPRDAAGIAAVAAVGAPPQVDHSVAVPRSARRLSTWSAAGSRSVDAWTTRRGWARPCGQPSPKPSPSCCRSRAPDAMSPTWRCASTAADQLRPRVTRSGASVDGVERSRLRGGAGPRGARAQRGGPHGTRARPRARSASGRRRGRGCGIRRPAGVGRIVAGADPHLARGLPSPRIPGGRARRARARDCAANDCSPSPASRPINEGSTARRAVATSRIRSVRGMPRACGSS